MSIGKKKGKKGSLGTSFIVEKIPGLKRISCSNCTNYNTDNSCSAKPVFITEIGYNYWTHCDSFLLDDRYDSEENRMIVNRSRKTTKKKKKRKRRRRRRTIIQIILLEIRNYRYIQRRRVVKHMNMRKEEELKKKKKVMKEQENQLSKEL